MKYKNKLFEEKTIKRQPLPETLTRSQKNNIERGNRIVDEHMTDMDISGAIRDQKGLPVINKDSGKVYNHLEEVNNGIRGLKKIIERLSGSLANPNIDETARKQIIYSINEYVKRIEKFEKGEK